MALPSSGPISFANFNATYGIALNAEISMYTAALMYYVPFNTSGTDPASMDEFYGLDQPYYDLYERCDGLYGPQRYYVPHNVANQFAAIINSTCCYKISDNVPYSDMQAYYPSAIFFMDIDNSGCFCGADIE
jgi:hypothetical protein